MKNLYEAAKELFPYTQSLRRDFHIHPELAFQEVRTSSIVAKELRALGLEVSTGIGKTGVTAIIEGAKPGPVIALRFDMDALPILEQTGAEYSSQNAGVMHACGHDGHVAIGLTVARLLNDQRDMMAGSVKLVFQPGEEGAGGAESVIKDGVLQGPEVSCILGLHVWNEKPLGWYGVAPGPVMASAGAFWITLTGKGGHGAMPHLAIDPVVAAAQIISAAQTISSRNVDPQQACVVSFCSIHGGDAFNVIPHEFKMKGTIRTFEPEATEIAYKRLREIASGIGEAMGCKVDVEYDNVTPAVRNDPATTEAVKRAAQILFSDENVDERGKFTMGAEDFAYYQQKVPGTFFFIGSTNEEKGLIYGHHHPKFDFDESALPRGAALMAQSALELLQP